MLSNIQRMILNVSLYRTDATLCERLCDTSELLLKVPTVPCVFQFRIRNVSLFLPGCDSALPLVSVAPPCFAFFKRPLLIQTARADLLSSPQGILYIVENTLYWISFTICTTIQNPGFLEINQLVSQNSTKPIKWKIWLTELITWTLLVENVEKVHFHKSLVSVWKW